MMGEVCPACMAHDVYRWLVTNSDACHVLPRLDNINYNPGVFIRFREQKDAVFGDFQYFYATNVSLERCVSYLFGWW